MIDRRTGWVALALLLLGSPIHALSSTVLVALDTDGVPTGGCSLSTPDGPFAGVEQLLTVAIETANATATVESIERQECVSGNFGAPVVVDPGDWPVGIGLGEGGSHVVEAYVPLAALGGATGSTRFGIVHVAGADADALLETAPSSGEPIVLLLATASEIPTVSQWGLLLLSLLLAATVLRTLRQRERHVAVLLIAVLGVCGLARAAGLLDGLIDDWSSSDRLALDAVDDAPDSVDLHAFFAKVEGTDLCLRIDTDLAFDQPPLAGPDSLSVEQDSVDNSLGSLLDNDLDPEGMPLTILSVGSPDQGGSASTDGQTILYTPASGFVGVETFTYTVGDPAGGTAVATVTVTVTPLCGNGTQEVLPQSRAVCSGVLYGTTVPSPTEASSLYVLDPATGAGTLVGTIAAPAVSLRRISAMDFDPAGVLFGIGSVGSQFFLVEIDCATAGATVIGALGLTASQGNAITDMSFDPFGRLWAHFKSVSGDQLGLVNRATGDYTTVGPTGLQDSGNGISSSGFPSSPILYHAGAANLSSLNQITGAATPGVALSFPPEADDTPRINAMEVDFDDGVAYVSVQNGPNGSGPESFVAGLDLATGEVVPLSDPIVAAPDSLDAIAVNRLYETCDGGSLVPVGASCGGACSLVESSCGDAQDNDFDGFVDCADPDCDLQPCDDGNDCTTPDTCSVFACVPGDPDPSCEAVWFGAGSDGDLLRADGAACKSATWCAEGGGLCDVNAGAVWIGDAAPIF